MGKSRKPNTCRLLEDAGIEYTRVEYLDESTLDAVGVAGKIGVDAERVFKTLVTRGDKTGVEVFCVPANEELDPKKAAVLTGNKRIEMVKPVELFELTGYIRGGCSPIGMRKPYRVHLDETAILHDCIYVSAGLRGMQLEINGEKLAGFIGAELADLAKA